MRVMFWAAAIFALTLASAFAACSGDVKGVYEKRPVGSAEAFRVFESFKIDSKTGTLSVCERNRIWNSEFRDKGNELIFVYARRKRNLAQSGDGTYVTPVWIAEFRGVKSEYRVRAVR